MRPFEAIIPSVLALYILWSLSGKQRPLAVNFAPIAAMGMVLLHSIFEGSRWQMIPIYIFALLAFLGSLPALIKTRQDKKPTSSARTTPWTVLSLSLLVTSTVLPILLPVPSVPVPTGLYPVGTQTFVLTDGSRRELYSGQDDPRKFMLRVWYPAESDPDTPRAPWMDNAPIYTREIATYLGLPEFFLDHMELVKIPAYLNAKPEPFSEGYPVIIFSHGWNGYAAQNTGQALELASRGFVVVGIQHTYGAVVTVFPDGKIANNNPNALPKSAPEAAYDQAARKLAEQWAGDISFTLEFLEEESSDSTSPISSTIDLNSIGVYGHSTGAGAAIQFCGTDTRCKALLGMDPFMTPVSEQVLDNGVSQPAFFMFSQSWLDDIDSKNNRLFKLFYKNVDPSTHVIGIQGTKHYDFTDLPMLSPIAPLLGLKGPIKGNRATEIINTYLTAFFEQTLRGHITDLFDKPSPYPEVIQVH